MLSTIDRRSFTNLLAATTVASYVLIALGTAVSTIGTGATCTTWPSCSTSFAIGPLSGDELLFWGHRAAALAAGVLVAATALAARKVRTDRRTRFGIAAAVVGFPVQVGLGATIVIGGTSFVATIHLALAMIIFAGLLVALVGTLERETDDLVDDAALVRSTPAPADDDLAIEDPTSSAIGNEGVATEPPSDASADRSGPESGETDGARTETIADRRADVGLREILGAYLTLTKPRLMWLLCLVAVAGMGLATLTGDPLEFGPAIATLAGGVLAIGASGTFNHVYERDRDRRMNRTSDRPLVHDLVPVRNAVAFGVALAVASIAVVLTWVNALAAALTLAAIVYYVVLYTVLLKPNTAWNTVLGGGAGALPALIGWAAVTGDVGLPAIALAAVIFLWTPAHFYSLAIAYRDDYARGGFPMFPVVAGVLAARRHVAFYLGATLLAASALGWVAGLGWVYAVASISLGAVFLRSVIRQYRIPTTDAALRSFYVSNAYLGVILLAIVVETLLVAS